MFWHALVLVAGVHSRVSHHSSHEGILLWAPRAVFWHARVLVAGIHSRVFNLLVSHHSLHERRKTSVLRNKDSSLAGASRCACFTLRFNLSTQRSQPIALLCVPSLPPVTQPIGIYSIRPLILAIPCPTYQQESHKSGECRAWERAPKMPKDLQQHGNKLCSEDKSSQHAPEFDSSELVCAWSQLGSWSGRAVAVVQSLTARLAACAVLAY